MKRLLALLLCLVMCVTTIPAAFAGDIEIVDTEDEALISLVDPVVTPGGELLASKPLITTQPTSITAYIDTTAKFTVAATGATSYQWQYRTSSTGSWKNSSLSTAKSATLKVQATEARSGLQYRCQVKNSAGCVYSDTVTLTVSKKPVITTQPASKTAAVGETVSFTVKATGATSYQWQYRKNSSSGWNNSGATGNQTATLSVKATEARNGYQYRCKVTNAEGTVRSKAATLSVVTKPSVTTQPLSYTASVGATVKFMVQATGATSYQWQYRKNSSSGWNNSTLSTAKTATLSVKATEARNDYQFRCQVTNAAGSTYSEPAALSVSDISCGEGLRWKLSSGGLLSVSGSGAMADAPKEESPWKRYASQITRVSVGSGVTSVGKHAFYGLSSLSSASLPSGLTKIGAYAFGSCSSLTGMKLPSSLTEIGTYAFRSCGSLTSIAIPDSVTSLGEYAFDYCKALKTVKIGSGVTSIGTWVFHYCDALESVTMSDSVTEIGFGAFYHTPALKSITLSKSLTTIGEQAFESSGLTSVTIPDSVTAIGGGAFSWTSLTSVTIGKGVKTIGSSAFSYSFSIADVYYRGTKTQWGKIQIDGGNDPLLNATMHYNYTG